MTGKKWGGAADRCIWPVHLTGASDRRAVAAGGEPVSGPDAAAQAPVKRAGRFSRKDAMPSA